MLKPEGDVMEVGRKSDAVGSRLLIHLSLSEVLAGLAGLSAVVASVVGFIPGLYRDRAVVVAQSHGYDTGNLLVALVLGLGLVWSARGSTRGRLLTIGALGCLTYSYVTYAFEIALNPATLLYVGVLGFAAWSFIAGLADVAPAQADAVLESRFPRRVAGAFLVTMGLLFALTWLSQIAQAALTGRLPAELVAAGWPMNPVYVLDLALVIPLAVLAGTRLWQRRVGGVVMAVPMLVFLPLLAISILAMAIFQALDGQALQVPMVALFAVIAVAGGVLAGLALLPPLRSDLAARGGQRATRPPPGLRPT
jgi:hypothetical protein